MAGEQINSITIANLDATPIVLPTAGDGAPGTLTSITDYAKHSANGTVTTSYYRLARFPSQAKIKRVRVYTDTPAATFTADVNVAWSDSLVDGTRSDLVGTIPTSALDGTTTTFASYTSPNEMFANAQAFTNSTEYDLTFAGSYTPVMREAPMYENLGFKDPSGVFAQDPGGFLDIFIVPTVDTTPATGLISVQVDYVV